MEEKEIILKHYKTFDVPVKINNNNLYINKLNEVHLIQDPNYNPESNIVHKYNKNSRNIK